jgi:hypothetical protein
LTGVRGRAEDRSVNQPTRTGFVSTITGIVSRAFEVIAQVVNRLITVTIRRPPTRCGDVDEHGEGFEDNPDTCNDFTVTVFGANGQLMVYPGRSQPETKIESQGGIKGFDAATRLESTFPPSSTVLVRAAHFGQPARIEAFAGGAAVGMQMMAQTPGVEQAFTFNGNGIDRFVVTPTGGTKTLVIEFCH